jgi:hypothetical protein
LITLLCTIEADSTNPDANSGAHDVDPWNRDENVFQQNAGEDPGRRPSSHNLPHCPDGRERRLSAAII